MDHFEKFLREGKTPTLIRAAQTPVQFESIHPFLDGNGRLGRLLITFMLCADGALKEPMLYLSLYFEQRRKQEYDLLLAAVPRVANFLRPSLPDEPQCVKRSAPI